MNSLANRPPNQPSIRRMPLCLRVLRQLKAQGRDVVSSTHLAELLDMSPILLKKDLALAGVAGKQGVGYQVGELIEGVEHFLGWDNVTDAFLVGAGNLGSALLGYDAFRDHGLRLVAAFDVDGTKVGTQIHGTEVLPLSKLPDLVRRMHVKMAVLTVPVACAQDVTDMLVRSGIIGIWNFTPVKLATPDGVVVQREDLASGFSELSIRLRDTIAAGGER